MEAFYKATNNPSETTTTKAAYNIWRLQNPTARPNLDANKLANVRRDIIKSKRLTEMELETIRANVRQATSTPEELNRSRPGIEDTDKQEMVEANVDENTSTLPESAGRTQKPTETKPDESMKAIKNDILRKWETVKYQEMTERLLLPKIKKDRRACDAIDTANKAIKEIKEGIDGPLTITGINQIVYATASTITEQIGLKPRQHSRIGKKQKEPAWKAKITKEIQKKRSDLSILTEIQNGSNIRERKRKEIEKRYGIKKPGHVPTIKETLKQQIQAKAQRIKRFEKRNKHFRQNMIFKEDAKKFYRELGKKKIDVDEPLQPEEVVDFWSNIWEKEKSHNKDSAWIKGQEDLHKDLKAQSWRAINVEETTCAINKSSNWKSPGKDKVSNFWLKHLVSLHEDLAKAYTKVIEHPEETPEWLTEGITHLLPKTEETKNPKNYRPITYLPTMYKIPTSIIAERTYMYPFLNEHQLLSSEQKGCKRGSYGCKDQLLMNKMILEDCKTKKKNLSTAWIDYKKAFDSVPHTWIIKCMEIYKICPVTVNFITESMKCWKTTLHLNHAEGSMTSRPINIKSGIFQGDSLSPLLFCLALAPLSSLLKATTYGYDAQGKTISHLCYMDDLKTYAKSDSQQAGLLNTVKTFSNDIKMEFGLDKCAKATFKRGKLTETFDLQLDTDTCIKELDQENTYKYLGVDEGDGIQHAKMKEKVRKEYYRRVRMVLKIELNAANRFEAINTLAIPVVTYYRFF